MRSQGSLKREDRNIREKMCHETQIELILEVVLYVEKQKGVSSQKREVNKPQKFRTESMVRENQEMRIKSVSFGVR